MKKKYRKGQKPIITTRKDLDRLHQEVVKESFILAAAYLVDEEGYDEDQIIDFWQSLIRWADAIDQHLITIETVTEIIKRSTGLKC